MPTATSYEQAFALLKLAQSTEKVRFMSDHVRRFCQCEHCTRTLKLYQAIQAAHLARVQITGVN